MIGVTIFAGWMAWRQAQRKVEQALVPHEQQIDLGAVVTRVRALNRLETASMRVVHVSTIKQTYDLIPNAFAGDELTLFAAGDVIAGIDLSQLKPEDVRRDPDGVLTIRLPPAQVLVTRLDNRQTHVLNRKTGWFRRADSGLESRARQYAEQGIRNEAINKGILQMASQNAELRVADLLRTFGLQRVRFEGAPASPSQG
ncbi:MAG TPA: DUF4230 domain-containing protein [Thermoanaerobaculia bacterium]|nr:DUF4230 domain-containing protein [Thermoanaerobaculia bacterium]